MAVPLLDLTRQLDRAVFWLVHDPNSPAKFRFPLVLDGLRWVWAGVGLVARWRRSFSTYSEPAVPA